MHDADYTEMSLPHAVVLVAGRGTRMKPLTGDLPKPLLPLHGRPLIVHVLDNLREAGFERFLLVVGYRAELFYARFAGDPTVHYVLQDPVDGTGSAALLAQKWAQNVPFLLIFGDILVDPADLRALWTRWMADPAAEAVVAVKHVDDPWRGAAVYVEEGCVTRFVEKPPRGMSTTNWNSAGIFAFRPSIFAELERLPLSARGEYELTGTIVQLLQRGARVLAHPLQGEWRDVGRPDDLDAAMRITS